VLARYQPIGLDVRLVGHPQKFSDRVEMIGFLRETPAVFRMFAQTSGFVGHQAP
jgi:hypothetical protein